MPFLISICIFVFVLSVFGEDTLIICVKCICICIISTCGLFARKCEETAIICRLARRCSREVRHIRHNRLQSIVNFLQPVDGRKGPSHIVLKCTQGLVIVINCARQQCLQHKETKKILDFHPFSIIQYKHQTSSHPILQGLRFTQILQKRMMIL